MTKSLYLANMQVEASGVRTQTEVHRSSGALSERSIHLSRDKKSFMT